jgi:hypothetical protein
MFPRSVRKNLSTRTAKVTIVEGTSVSRTIVVFVNRALTDQAAPNEVSVAYGSDTSLNTFQMGWQDL